MSNGAVAEGCRGPAIVRCVCFFALICLDNFGLFLDCFRVLVLARLLFVVLRLCPRAHLLSVTVCFVRVCICSRLCPCAIRVVLSIAVSHFFKFFRSRPIELDVGTLIFILSILLFSSWLWWFSCLVRRVAARRSFLTWVAAMARLPAI